MEAPQNQGLDKKLTQLTESLNELKSLYEQYFAGILKIEPHREHQKWKQDFQSLQSADTKTTGQKFKLSNLKSRYAQLNNLWGKTCKQIEEGTYRRDKFLQSKTPSSPDKKPETKASSSTDKIVESLYRKISEASKLSGIKVPSKDKFAEKVSSQIKLFKEKNPQEKMELKLKKDKSGQLQIQISAKKS